MKSDKKQPRNNLDNQIQTNYDQSEPKNAQKSNILYQNIENQKKLNEIQTQYDEADFKKIQKNIIYKKKHEKAKNSKIQEVTHSLNIEECVFDNSDDDIVKLKHQNNSESSNTTTKESESFINSQTQKKYYEKYQSKNYLQQKSQSQQEEFANKIICLEEIEKKNNCQGCIQKLHKLSSMELLKNQYYKSFLLLKHQVEQLKNNKDKDSQNQGSSFSLNDILDNYNDESQKSQFSFENIESNILADRFIMQVEQFSKLISKALLIELNLTDVKAWSSIPFSDLQKKIIQLKSHLKLHLDRQDQTDFYEIQQKNQLKIKMIQQKYKKLIQKIIKGFKEKQKRVLNDFQKVNSKFIEVLQEKQSLSNQIQKMRMSARKSERQSEGNVVTSPTASLKEFKFQLTPSNTRRNSFQRVLSPQNMATIFQQKSIELERNLQRSNMKIKDLQKNNKKNQKKIQELSQQLVKNKKKSANEIFIFMERLSKNLVSNKNIKIEDIFSSKKNINLEEATQTISTNKSIRQKTFISDTSHCFQISQISELVYEIFAYTSDDFDTQENIFSPQTKQELIKMLQHIKTFNKNFDTWQKEKEKQTINFQKNFLKLIKFFIDSYQISQEKLLQQIDKIQNKQSLKDYIRKYYILIMQQKRRQFSQSSDFTFGKTSSREYQEFDCQINEESHFGSKDQN